MLDPVILFVHIIATLPRLVGPGGIRSVARVLLNLSSKNSKPFLAFSKSQEKFIEVFRFDQRLGGPSPIFKTWRVNRKNVDAIRENRSSIV